MTPVRKEYQVLFPEAKKAELRSCSRSESPVGPREIEGRTLYTLISNGTELNVYLGYYEEHNLSWGRFPFVPGYAGTMEVETVGSEVNDIRPGDLVFCIGLHQSFQRCDRETVLPLPKGLPPARAPFARLMNVTMSTLTTTTAHPPARVIVTGLGPIGLMGAKMFQRCGYKVTGCDPVAERRETALASGLADVRAAVPLDDPALVGKVSLVLECSAHEQAVLDGLGMLEKRGELVQVGVPMSRKTEIYAQEILNRMFRQNAVLRSGSEWEVPKHPTVFRHGSCYGNMAAGLDWLNEESVTVDELFDTIAPSDPQAVYQDLLAKRTAKPCVMFDWRDVGQGGE